MADSSPPSSVARTSRPTRRRRVATMEEEELSPRGSPELISINQLDVADIATKNVVDASPQQQHLLPTRDQQRTSIRRGVEMDGDLLQRTVHRAMDVDDSSYYRNHDASCNNDDDFVGEDMLHNTSSILIRSTRNNQPPATTKQRRSHDADELIDYLHHLSRCAARGRKQMKTLRHQDIRSYRAKLREERRRAPPPQRSVGKHSAGHHRHVVDDIVGVSHEEALELVEYLRTLREEVEDKAPSSSKRSTKTSSSSTSSPSSSPPRTLHSDSVAQPSNSSAPSSSARDGDGAMNIVDYVRRMRAEDDGETPPRNHPPSSSVASSGRSSKRSNTNEKMDDGDDDGPSMASTRKPSSSASSSTRTPRELYHTDIASTAPPSMPATLEVPSDDDLTRGPHPSTTSASANDPSAEEERSAMAFLKQLQAEAAFGRYAKQQQEQQQQQRAPSSTDATQHDVNASLPRAPQANKPETCSRGVQYMDDVDVGHRKNTLDSTGYVHSSSPIFSSPRHPHTSASPLNARDSDGRRTSSRNQITTPEVQGSSSANKHVQLQLPLPQRHSSLRSASAMGDDRSANASARRRTSSTPLVVSRSSTAKDIIWSMPSERVLSAMASTRSREASLDRSARSTTSPRGESDGRRTSSQRRTSSVDAATDPIPSPMKHHDEDARIIPSPPQHTVNDDDRNQRSTTNISISSVPLPPSSANQSLAGALPPLRLAQQHVEGVVPHVHACSSPLQRTHSSAATSPPPRASSETPPVNDDVLNAQRAEVRRRLTISTSELRDEAYGALSGINTIIAKRLLRRAHRRKAHPPRLRPLKDGGSGVVGDVDADPPRRSVKKQQQQHDAPQSTNEGETLVAGPPQQHRKKRKKKNAAPITDAQQTHEAQPPPPTVPPLWSTTPTPTDPVMMNAANIHHNNTNKQAPSAAAEMAIVQPGKNLPSAAHVPSSAPHDASTVVEPEKMVPSSSSSPAAPTPTTMDVAPSTQDAPTTTPPPQHDVPPTSSISPRFPPTTDDGQPITSTSSANHLPHNHNTSLEQPPHLTSDDKNTMWHSHPSLLAQSGSGRLSQLPLPTGVDAVDGVIHQRSRDTSLRSSPRISAGPTPRPQDSETVGDDGDVGAADANNNDGEVLVYFHRDASSADTTSASMSVPKLISPRDLRQPTPRDAEEMREEVRRLSSRSTMSPDTHDALSSGLHRDSSRAGPASPSVSGSDDDDDDDDESPPIVGALEPPHGTDSSSSASSKSPPPSVCSTSIGGIKTHVDGATKNMDDDDDDGFSPRSSPSPTPSPTPTTHGATDASSYNSSITARPHPRSNTPTHVDGDEGDHLVDAAHADEHATDDGVPTLNDPNMYEDAQSSSSSSANSGVDDAPPHTIATRSSAADGDGAATSSAHMKDPHARPSTADTQAPPHEAPTTTTTTTMLAPSSSVMYAPTTQVDEPQKVVETKAIVIQRPTPTPHDELPSSTPHTRDDAHGTTRSSNYTTDSSDESEEEEDDDDDEEDGISSTAEEAISHETSTIIRHTSPRGDGQQQQQQHPPTHEDKNPVYIPKPNYVVCGPTPPSMEQIHGPSSSSSSPATQPHEEDDEEDEDEEEDEEEEDYADVDLDDVDDDLYQDVEPPSARKHAAAATRGEGHPHSPLTSSAAALNHLPSASPNTRNTWRAIGRQQQQQPLRRYPQYMPTRTTTTTTSMPVPRTSNSPPRRHDDGGVAASLDSFAEPLKRSGTAEGDRGEVELADTLRRADSASPPSHDASRCALPNKSSSSTTAPTTTTATTTAAAAPPSSSSPAFTTVLPHDDDDLASAIVVAKAKRPASTSSTHSSTGTDSTASSYVPLHERRPQKERTFSVPTINVKDNTNNNSGSITSARRPKKVKVCSPTRSQRLQPSSSRTASNASSTGSSTADASAQHRRKHKHRKQAQPPTTSSPGESAEAEAPPSSLVVRFSRRAPSKAHATSPSKKKQRSATRSPSSNPAPPQDTPPLPTTTITPTKMKKKLMKPKPSPHVVAAPIPHPPSTPKLKVAVRGAPRTTTTTTIKATRSGVRTPQKPTAKIPVPSQHAQPRRRKDPLPPHTSPPRRSTPTTTTPSLSSSPPAQLAPTTPRSASASSHRSGSETPKKKAPMRFSPLHRRASDVDDSPRPSSRKPIIPDEARGRPRSSPQRTINVLEVPHNDDDHLHERRKPPIPAMFHRRASAVAAMELAPQKKKKRKMMANIYSGNAQRRRRRSLKKRMRQPPPLMLPMDLDFADSAKAYALIHTPSDDDDDGNDDTRKHATPSSPAANSADQSDAHQRMSVLECVNQRLHILNPQEIQRYLHHADPLLIGSTSTKSRGKKKKHARTPREKRISAAEEDDPYAYLLSRHGFWGEHRPGL